MTYSQALLEQADPRLIEEAVLQRAVVEKAQERGFKVFYVPDDLHQYAAKGERWDLMPYAGWPDLALGGHGRLIMVELKAQKGVLGSEQKAWRDILRAAGVEWYCWRPRDWPAIVELLEGAR